MDDADAPSLEGLVRMVGILYDKYMVLYANRVDDEEGFVRDQLYLDGYAQAVHDIIDTMNADGLGQ